MLMIQFSPKWTPIDRRFPLDEVHSGKHTSEEKQRMMMETMRTSQVKRARKKEILRMTLRQMVQKEVMMKTTMMGMRKMMMKMGRIKRSLHNHLQRRGGENYS
ncbi:hypothetical protein L6164_011459 [Bauhinia variegata]|uniref:Uncharacterized protein n=1 Tax=Bauhinia variegata TaxID=167791 RepID=A0ACB9P6Y0_BAUVA|nr:hypothetical protein L6164_011459 [Bauhinia variegata]